MRLPYSIGAVALLMAATPVAAAAPLPFGGLPTDYAYVELADMALAARSVAAADIAEAIPVKGSAAAGLPTGQSRYYVQADVRTLISGAGLPSRISYLIDLPDGEGGKRRKLKGVPVLLLVATVDAAGQAQLAGPRAQVPRTHDNEARLRSILTGVLASDAPPAITGVARAFHVAGSLPGEGETQIFLRTADRRPISLSVLRRPNEQPRWAVALSELVDDSAAPPPPDSLLWYRLACGLPSQLPDGAVAGLSAEDADAARADYQVVVTGLGACRR